jgi:predicted  nucleic acid-binding Zn-ribbon protein
MPLLEISPMKELFLNLLKLQELEFGDAGGSKVEAAISALRLKIPPPILGHYDRLTARGKTGVAIVRHQVCTGCHMRIPLGSIITLMHEEDVQMCGNCGRYLVVPPEAGNEAIEVPEVVATPKGKSKPKQKPLVNAA